MTDLSHQMQHLPKLHGTGEFKGSTKLDEVFMGILNEFTYFENQIGQRFLSKDVGCLDAVQLLKCAQIFNEEIIRCTDSPTHIFEKTLDNTSLKSTSKLAQYYYQCIANRWLPSLANYEASPAVDIYCQIARELRIHEVVWSWNPLHVVSTSGLLEGELFNSLVMRLQGAFSTKEFIGKVAARKSKSRAEYLAAKRYFERLHANFQNLYVQRIEMAYSLCHAEKITIQESARHVTLFTAALPQLGLPVGWWWKREFTSETSHRYSFIIIFDANTTLNFEGCAQALGNLWQEVTENTGKWEMPFDLSNHKARGQSFSGYKSTKQQVESLLASVKLMCQRDIYLRLRPNKRFPHVGMGELPKLSAVNSRTLSNPSPQPQYWRAT